MSNFFACRFTAVFVLVSVSFDNLLCFGTVRYAAATAARAFVARVSRVVTCCLVRQTLVPLEILAFRWAAAISLLVTRGRRRGGLSDGRWLLVAG